MQVQTCRKCLVEKPLEEFYKRSQGKGRFINCKKCDKEYLREQRKKPELAAKFKLYQWRALLKRQYGITETDYMRMLEAQGRGCAICGRETASDGFQKRLHVDHCHDTGVVRGLLCGNCNSGIGRLKNSPTLLRNAAEYLEVAHGQHQSKVA